MLKKFNFARGIEVRIMRLTAVLLLTLGCGFSAGAAESSDFTAAQRRLWSLQKLPDRPFPP
jgi:hypothetical protein